MRAFLRGQARAPFAYAAAFAVTGLAWVLSQYTPANASPQVPMLVFAVATLGAGAFGGRGPALFAAGLSLLAVDYFFVPAAGTFKLPYTVADIVTFAAFAGVAGIGAWLSHVARRATRETARAEAVAARLAIETRHREALLELGQRALAGGRAEAIGRDAIAVTAAALGVDCCAILELASDDDRLVIASATGGDAGAIEGLEVATDVDTQAGYALHAREPVVVLDADAASRFSLPPALRARGVRSGVAARIAGVGRPFGAIVAYATSPRTYAVEEMQFVSGVAAVLAGMYERKRLDAERGELCARDKANRSAAELASKRAAFLAQTATVFDTALEPDATLVSLARLAVPSLAECAIVDLVHEDGRVRRVDIVEIDPGRRDLTESIRRQAPDIRSETPLARAIRTGQPALLSRPPEREPEAGGDPERDRLIRLLHCQSLLLIPLVARGQTLGLLTLASRERRYEALDLAAGQELAGRAAIALDNARLYREARAASRAKDDFLATVSHELRTPINAVLGWAAMLREHRLDEARTDSACDAIERSARAQAQLLEQLLDVSRGISGKLELRLAPAQISGIIEAAIDAVRPDAQAKQVRIASRLDRRVPLLMVDPERLQQLVVNILANAVKFSPENGLVEVELRRDEGFVEIVVQDHGIGIRREFLPYVFERFRQAGPTPGTVNRGLGLGMSIARDIVEHHGGVITADSAGEGRGSTFTVRLPLHSASEPLLLGRRMDDPGVSPSHPIM